MCSFTKSLVTRQLLRAGLFYCLHFKRSIDENMKCDMRVLIYLISDVQIMNIAGAYVGLFLYLRDEFLHARTVITISRPSGN